MGVIDDIKTLVNSVEEPTTKPPGENKTVLIVEDEKAFSNAIEIKLKPYGFRVLKAENGEIGLDIIQKEKINLVILDLMMPVMNGTLMLRKMREKIESKKIPVIVLTNAGSIDNLEETKVFYDASEFLVKSNTSLHQLLLKVLQYTKG